MNDANAEEKPLTAPPTCRCYFAADTRNTKSIVAASIGVGWSLHGLALQPDIVSVFGYAASLFLAVIWLAISR